MKKTLAVIMAAVMMLLCFGQAAVLAEDSTASEYDFDFSIVRLGGSDRIETANTICAAGWPDAHEEEPEAQNDDLPEASVSGPDVSGSDAADSSVSSTDVQPSAGNIPSDNAQNEHTYAVLANAYNFADALAGVPLAYAFDAPILLTDGSALRSTVTEQLERIGADCVYILGGEGAVSADVEKELTDAGYSTVRLAGETRFGTAAAIARELAERTGSKPDTVFVAYGYNYPDALSAGAAAALMGAPIVYSDASGVPDSETAQFISEAAPELVILGGELVISSAAETNFGRLTAGSIKRLYGSDRFETALKLYESYRTVFPGSDISLASGMDFPDALAGGAFAAKLGIPVMPVSTVKTTEGIYDLVRDLSPEKVYIFGGDGAVSSYVVNTLLSGGTVTTAAPPVPEQPFTAPLPENHILRTVTVKVSSAKAYADVSTSSSVVAVLSRGQAFDVLDEKNGAGEITWFKIKVNGRDAWICRTNVNIANQYIPIAGKTFSADNKPVIYLSPSKQGHNAYATGGTTEQREMEAVAKVMKQILDAEYDCVAYIATPTVDIDQRADEAWELGTDIYIAIHSNATGDSSVCHGASVYYFPACAQSMLMAQNIVSELNKIAPAGVNIGQQVINGMNAFYNIGYAEVRCPSDYGMISVLAETEFHDNAVGSNWIRTHHEQIARAYVNALVKTYNIQEK